MTVEELSEELSKVDEYDRTLAIFTTLEILKSEEETQNEPTDRVDPRPTGGAPEGAEAGGDLPRLGREGGVDRTGAGGGIVCVEPCDLRRGGDDPRTGRRS